jgi:hypothetical protein
MFIIQLFLIQISNHLGPIPCLFAEDEQAVLSILDADPHKIAGDVNKLVKLFPVVELVNLAEAAKVVATPRAGNATFPFKRSKGKRGGSAKRSKRSDSVSDSGTIQVFKGG